MAVDKSKKNGKAPDTTGAPKRGRPSSFKPEYIQQAEKLCKLGATDAQIADFFGISIMTLYRWKHQHEEFCDVIKIGQTPADNSVERSLYQRAIGYDYTEKVLIKVRRDGEDVIEEHELVKHQHADVTAGIFWLKNRRRDEWNETTHHRHELNGAIDIDVRKLSSTILSIFQEAAEEEMQLIEHSEAAE